MSVADGLILYTLILVVAAVLAWLTDTLWYSNHDWSISKSRLMSCGKCGHVFLLGRQCLDRRCPVCGARAHHFRMPYSGVHETMVRRANNLKG